MGCDAKNEAAGGCSEGVDGEGFRPEDQVVEAEQESDGGCGGDEVMGWTHEIDEQHSGGAEDQDDGRGAQLEVGERTEGKKGKEQTGGARDDPAGAV